MTTYGPGVRKFFIIIAMMAVIHRPAFAQQQFGGSSTKTRPAAQPAISLSSQNLARMKALGRASILQPQNLRLYKSALSRSPKKASPVDDTSLILACNGQDQLIAKTCSARVEQANIWAHVRSNRTLGDNNECLIATANLLGEIVVGWDKVATDYAGQYPCGHFPEAAKRNDGILRFKCPSMLWNYDNIGSVGCRAASEFFDNSNASRESTVSFLQDSAPALVLKTPPSSKDTYALAVTVNGCTLNWDLTQTFDDQISKAVFHSSVSVSDLTHVDVLETEASADGIPNPYFPIQLSTIGRNITNSMDWFAKNPDGVATLFPYLSYKQTGKNSYFLAPLPDRQTAVRIRSALRHLVTLCPASNAAQSF